MEEIYTPKQDYKVLVRCFTYNQSKYIEDALNGFAMQQTNFPFVSLVMDDCSTDGEQEVIKAWMQRECDIDKAEYIELELANVVHVPHKSNANCTFVFYFLKQNLYKTGKKKTLVIPWREHCKYEAICEGDDYWIYNNRLQKHVSYLEEHKDCMMACSDAIINTPKGNVSWTRYKNECNISTRDMILGGGLWVQTCTATYRRDVIQLYNELDYTRKCHVGDYCWQIISTIIGYVHFFPEKTAVYRYQLNDSWTYRDKTNNYLKKVKGWRSEVNMLQGLDAYSENKYHKYFKKRENDYVRLCIIKSSHNHLSREYREVASYFTDIIEQMNIIQKLEIWFLCNNLYYIRFFFSKIVSFFKSFFII